MDVILIIILLSSFIPTFNPFRAYSDDDKGIKSLYISYFTYLLAFLLFCGFAIWGGLYFGNELGDLYYYFIFSLAMVVANLGMGLRNNIGKEFKLFFTLLNIISSIFVLTMLLKS